MRSAFQSFGFQTNLLEDRSNNFSVDRFSTVRCTGNGNLSVGEAEPIGSAGGN